jgi:hypothetical protein
MTSSRLPVDAQSVFLLMALVLTPLSVAAALKMSIN